MVVWWDWFMTKTIRSSSHLLLIFLGLVWVFFVPTPSEGSLPALFSLLFLHRLLFPFHNLSSCLIPSSALSCASWVKVDYPAFPQTYLGLVTDRAVREELQRWCSWWCGAWVTWSRPRALALFVPVCIYFLLKVTGISQLHIKLGALLVSLHLTNGLDFCRKNVSL